MTHHKKAPEVTQTEGDESIFVERMIGVFAGQREWVIENGCSLLEGDTVLRPVCSGLVIVPFKEVCHASIRAETDGDSTAMSHSCQWRPGVTITSRAN